MTGVIILAAGSSSRLGQPKQNLIYREKTLLQHAIDEARSSNADVVLVVLGANEDRIASTLNSAEINIISNRDWQEGMSSSIRCGMNFLAEKHQEITQVIIMLCDQPFVDADILNKLIEERENSGKDIVACQYDDTLGTPALFTRSCFSGLQGLATGQGAKKLILENTGRVAVVHFPGGAKDIDTYQDYQSLI